MTSHISGAVFWPVAVVAATAVAMWVRQAAAAARLRKRLAAAEQEVRSREADIRVREAEVAHLVDVRLPAVELGGRRPRQGLRDERLAGTAYGERMDLVVNRFVGAVEKARVRADQSAKATLKAAMRSVQALANEQQLSISDMQDRHDSPYVLQDLMEIDHANSQFGRRAQAIAVLCGSWPGRQRAASPLIDVLRGAKSRIRDYQRVEIGPGPDVDVVSRAVEPVVLAVAELLDNATRHSQPNTSVEVTLRPAHNGTTIVIDDAGVGMDELEVSLAVERLGGGEDLDINRLGDPPQFGFAVIGVLAARYGFSVSVDTRSPYGGVRAVLFLPKALLVTAGTAAAPVAARAAHHRAPAPGELPVRAPAGLRQAAEQPTAAPDPAWAAEPEHERAPGDDDVTETPITGATAGGLPKRRRRQVSGEQLATRAAQAPADEDTGPVRTPYETASRMGAFARGTRSGRAESADDEGTTQG
ncbi:ATP-binding protein [Actinacidiphila bryophytorum]|uniref:ATP-binding protein n=1 Tax=Actinacidiphila bryophytorum TaxID=1436133 RepID=UPI002176E3EB|nr:ATP-binding protein [Actinacidiphila bryophytorum]UWE08070.1 ATP-binding protein [Actinacidiphila bryophytorum]